MHPELISALAAERRRDLAASAIGHPGRPRARRPRLPRYRLTWSHTSLGAAATGSGVKVAAGRRERSWVIVISATRATRAL
jgi:hypothetical protein